MVTKELCGQDPRGGYMKIIARIRTDFKEKFGKKVGAIGFAIYLDKLERLESDDDKFDVDVMLVYDEDTSPKEIIAAARELGKEGSVRTLASVDRSVRYRKLVRLGKDGQITLETND